jgi:hypothetical protein
LRSPICACLASWCRGAIVAQLAISAAWPSKATSTSAEAVQPPAGRRDACWGERSSELTGGTAPVIAPCAQGIRTHLRLGPTTVAVKPKWRCPWAILVAPMATVVALKHGNLVVECYCLAGTPKRRYKEMPGQRSHASRLIGRRLRCNPASMLPKRNIGKKPGNQAD